MKLGIVGTGQVGGAIAIAAVTRGSAREIVLVNRTRMTGEAVATDIRYGAPLCDRVEIAPHIAPDDSIAACADRASDADTRRS
jgi:malate/lactate dehydrogenase